MKHVYLLCPSCWGSYPCLWNTGRLGIYYFILRLLRGPSPNLDNMSVSSRDCQVPHQNLLCQSGKANFHLTALASLCPGTFLGGEEDQSAPLPRQTKSTREWKAPRSSPQPMTNENLCAKFPDRGLRWSSGWDSMLPIQGTCVSSLIRELDPTGYN